jgi:DNA-binding CsgD family transcriptional regulator
MTVLADSLQALFLRPDLFVSAGPYGKWVQEQYILLAPAVLEEALRCAEAGEQVSPALHDAIQHAARAAAVVDIPMSVIVRGGIPALQSIAHVIAREAGTPSRSETALFMGRASLVAWELSAVWWESWSQTRREENGRESGSLVDGQSLDIVAVGTSDGLPGSSLEMLALAANGASTEEIADATSYSPQAVKWHFARAMKAWKVSNRTALVSIAFLRGVLVRRKRERRRPLDPPRAPSNMVCKE